MLSKPLYQFGPNLFYFRCEWCQRPVDLTLMFLHQAWWPFEHEKVYGGF